MVALSLVDEQALSLIADEIWDLTAAIDELEARRKKLRDATLDLCRARSLTRWAHARGSLRIDRYESYKVTKPSAVLAQITAQGWEDQALSVKGRALLKLAATEPSVKAQFDATLPRVKHEGLVMSPARKR